MGPRESVKPYLGRGAGTYSETSLDPSALYKIDRPPFQPPHKSNLSFQEGRKSRETPEKKKEKKVDDDGGVGGADQGVRLRGARRGGLRLPQLLDELPGRRRPQEVQGVLPDAVRHRGGEQGRQALQLRPEGAPELAGDDAALLRHAAARRPAAPGRRRRARGHVHRRQVLLLQGLRHRRPGEPPQAWGAQLLGDNRADPLHGVVRHQPRHQGGDLRFPDCCLT